MAETGHAVRRRRYRLVLYPSTVRHPTGRNLNRCLTLARHVTVRAAEPFAHALGRVTRAALSAIGSDYFAGMLVAYVPAIQCLTAHGVLSPVLVDGVKPSRPFLNRS